MITGYLEQICTGGDLSATDAQTVFSSLVKGELQPSEIAALLVGLRTKGESAQEIEGAARALRAEASPFERPDYDVAELVGTGGDGAHTINVSTAGALLAATMGIPVAKHGNRSISSLCGAADVLEQIGIKIDASAATMRWCLDDVGFCFFYAPLYHSGLRHAGPIRKQLGIRTVMNILGPLVNPAAPTHQLTGVYDPGLCMPLAQVLARLGMKSAMVIHGSGLDEVAVHGPTTGAYWDGRTVEPLTFTPTDLGLPTYPIGDLRGGPPEVNVALLQAAMAGTGKDAHHAAIAASAGVLAFLFGRAPSLKAGCTSAMDTLMSGKCAQTIARLKERTHGS